MPDVSLHFWLFVAAGVVGLAHAAAALAMVVSGWRGGGTGPGRQEFPASGPSAINDTEGD